MLAIGSSAEVERVSLRCGMRAASPRPRPWARSGRTVTTARPPVQGGRQMLGTLAAGSAAAGLGIPRRGPRRRLLAWNPAHTMRWIGRGSALPTDERYAG